MRCDCDARRARGKEANQHAISFVYVVVSTARLCLSYSKQAEQVSKATSMRIHKPNPSVIPCHRNFNLGMFAKLSCARSVSNWDVSSNTNFAFTFYEAVGMNFDISGWDTAAATSMKEMFAYASDFNQDISNLDVSNVANFNAMLFDSGISSNQKCTAVHSFSAQNSNFNAATAGVSTQCAQAEECATFSGSVCPSKRCIVDNNAAATFKCKDNCALYTTEGSCPSTGCFFDANSCQAKAQTKGTETMSTQIDAEDGCAILFESVNKTITEAEAANGNTVDTFEMESCTATPVDTVARKESVVEGEERRARDELEKKSFSARSLW